MLTDGENTYYTPSSLSYNDLAANKSTYSSYGYAGRAPTGYSYSRMFQGVPASINKTDYSNANYTKALNAQFATVCANAKAAKVLLLTVALDLDPKNTAEKSQIDALESCASDSRFRKGPTASPQNCSGTPPAAIWRTHSKRLPTNCRTCASSDRPSCET